MNDVLHQYVIYARPKDFPDKFVVRRWNIGPGVATPEVEPFSQSDTLEEARESLPEGLYQMPRFDADDAVIVEVWM